MEISFTTSRSIVANRVTMGDKHDTSIEMLLKKHAGPILIVPRGDKYEVMPGEITIKEKDNGTLTESAAGGRGEREETVGIGSEPSGVKTKDILASVKSGPTRKLRKGKA